MPLFDRVFGGKKEEEAKIPGVPDDLGNVLALLDGREPTNDDRLRLAGGVKPEDILPVTTALASKPPEPPKPAFDPSKLEVGQMVEGKGVYVGVQEVTTKGGLKKVFDLYASPEDLTDGNNKKLVATYNDSVKALKQKKGWHGYDGECFENHKELEAALADDTYEGGWFIPTREVVKENLYKNKDKGDLKGTFTDKSGSDGAHWYWSCTERPFNSSYVYSVNFTDGYDGWDGKDDCKLSTRPVRAELRPL
jgi:hypothetical protein